MLKTQIRKLLLDGKTDEEIVSELSPGINLSPQRDKVFWQNPPRIMKPTLYYNKYPGFKRWKEKGRHGVTRDRNQGHYYST